MAYTRIVNDILPGRKNAMSDLSDLEVSVHIKVLQCIRRRKMTSSILGIGRVCLVMASGAWEFQSNSREPTLAFQRRILKIECPKSTSKVFFHPFIAKNSVEIALSTIGKDQHTVGTQRNLVFDLLNRH